MSAKSKGSSKHRVTAKKVASQSKSLAEVQAAGLHAAIAAMKMLPAEGTRPLAVVHGLTPQGHVVGQYDAKLSELTSILVETGQVYRLNDRVVMEIGRAEGGSLVDLADRQRVDPAAHAHLANHVIAEIEGDAKKFVNAIQFPVPATTINALLHRQTTRDLLPAIESYYRRPMFTGQFQLLAPGYHAAERVLIHGPAIEPAQLGPVRMTAAPLLERLPPHLRQLLGDFCFASEADNANAVAMLLTGLLINLYVVDGKPFFVLDGNQPGLGKTWLVLVWGILMDGEIPQLDSYTADEAELEKRIGARIRTSTQSVMAIDNARVRSGEMIANPFLESCITAPIVSGRILGTSTTYSRSNDRLWIITMNGARLGSDLTSRCVPIRFYFEGNPQHRDLGGRKPIYYARQYRSEILGELAGMVYRWVAAGCTPGQQPHRMERWAAQVGGIMAANGLPEFLANLEEAAAAFDNGRGELASLVEKVMHDESHGPFVFVGTGQAGDPIRRAKSPLDWARYLTEACIQSDRLRLATSEQSKRTIVGSFLAPHVDRPVELEVKGDSLQATLRCAEARGRKKLYYFAVEVLEGVAVARQDELPCSKPGAQCDDWDSDPTDVPRTVCGGPTEPVEKRAVAEVHRR